MSTSIRTTRRAPFVLVAALLLAGTAPRAAAQDMGIKVGTLAPGAMVAAMDGTMMDLASLYGETPVVLEFWATWCPLCRQLEPAMQAAREKHGATVRFVSVGVSANQSAERQLAHATRQKMGGLLVFDRDDAAMKAFGVPHTSYVVVIDRHRRVVYTGVGAAQDIEAALALAGEG